MSAGYSIGATRAYSLLLGAGACIFLRLMAIYRGWRVPVARHRIDPGSPGGR